MQAKPAQPTSSDLLRVIGLLLLGPLVALLLYVSVLGNGIDAPDLSVISGESNASATLPMDSIWLKSFPAEQPDLGHYRPIHGMLLKLQYALWPGKIRAFRALSLAMFVAMNLVFALLVFRLVKGNLARAAALLVMATHPMATESVNSLAAQNALLAGLASVVALYAYHLALAGNALRPLAAVHIVVISYLIAFGSFEAAVLLPVALFAMELLAPHKTESTTEPARGGFAGRLLIYGVPLLAVCALLAGLRVLALGGHFGAQPWAQSLPEHGFVGRILAGISAAALGLSRLLLPLKPTFIYSARYESSLIWPAAIGVGVVAAFGLAILFGIWKNRILALGLIWIALPLLTVTQIVPSSEFFSERVLLLSLPGFALVVGEAVAILERAGSEATRRNRQPLILAATVVLAVIFAAISFARNMDYTTPSKFWDKEVSRSPKSPAPLVQKLIRDISRPEGGFQDAATIKATAASALALAQPPDGDAVRQYLALFHLQRGEAEELKKLLDEALAVPGPHVSGYYSSLGDIALRANFDEIAEAAFGKELERDPEDFYSLITLGELYLSREDWPKAFEIGDKARAVAPSNSRGLAEYRFGAAALRMKEHVEEGVRALTNSITIDRTIPEAYILIARHFVEIKEYARAEQALTMARQNTVMPTYVELYKIQVDSLERQKKDALVLDFLRQMAGMNPFDVPTQLYAAKYLYEHGDHATARTLYATVLEKSGQYAEAMLGLARISLEKDNNPAEAYSYIEPILQSDPQNAEAQEILATIREKFPPPATPTPVK